MVWKRAREISHEWDEETLTKRYRGVDIPTVVERALRPPKGLEQGHATVDAIRAAMYRIDTYDGGKYQRSYRQVLGTESILASLAAFIYGDCFAANELIIKKRNGWKTLHNGLILSAPRRIGKTIMCAILFSALIVACLNIDITCISASANAAGSEIGILGKVRRFLENIFKITSFENKNKTHIIYKVSHNDIRQIHSFSGKVGDG